MKMVTSNPFPPRNGRAGTPRRAAAGAPREATGKTERLSTPRQPLRYGIALSPDGRYLLHAQTNYEVSDLMLVEGFR